MTLEDDFRDMVAWEQSLRARGVWFCGPATTLEAAGVLNREVAMTAVLAYLLRPDGRHRAGRLFLDAFTEVVDVPKIRAPVTVVLEEARDTDLRVETIVRATRADLVLRGTGACVVIESKVHAVEQAQQLERLRTTWAAEGNPRFVFLTPGAHSGKTGDASWRAISWSQVAGAFREAAADAHVSDLFADSLNSLERVGLA